MSESPTILNTSDSILSCNDVFSRMVTGFVPKIRAELNKVEIQVTSPPVTTKKRAKLERNLGYKWISPNSSTDPKVFLPVLIGVDRYLVLSLVHPTARG